MSLHDVVKQQVMRYLVAHCLLMLVSGLMFSAEGERFPLLPRSFQRHRLAYGDVWKELTLKKGFVPPHTRVFRLTLSNSEVTVGFWRPASLESDLSIHFLQIKSMSERPLTEEQLTPFDVPAPESTAWRADEGHAGVRKVFLAQKGFTRDAFLSGDSRVCTIITGDYKTAAQGHDLLSNEFDDLAE